MATILDRIIDAKRVEVASRKAERSMEAVVAAAESAPPVRDFRAAITGQIDHRIHLIAEIKRKSPSAGLLVEDFDPKRIASAYHRAGASAISVLTDEPYFGGSLEMLTEVRAEIPCPVLRKDFILEAYQVYEARAAGADAVLLIAEAIGVEKVASLLSVVEALGMGALIEVHDVRHLWSVTQRIGAQGASHILGINNRDLAVQRTDILNTARLAALLPEGTPFVSESGISCREDVLTVQAAGARAILVGESLLRAESIEERIRDMLGEPLDQDRTDPA